METSIFIRRLTGTGKGKEDYLHTQEVSFGSGPHNTLRFDPVWDRGVALSHARVYRDESGNWWAEDNGSPAGTFINGQKLTVKRKIVGGFVIELGQGGPKVEIMLPPAEEAGVTTSSDRGGGRSSGSGSMGKGLAIAAGVALLVVGAWYFLKGGSKSTGAENGNVANTAAPTATAPSQMLVADSDEKLRLLAKKYEQAVGVVVIAQQGSSKPCGTAWAVAPNTFATNSHITEAVEPLLAEGGAAFVVINKNPNLRFRVLKVVTHPDYYSDAKAKAGEPPPLNPDGKTQQIGAYDVGLLIVDGDPPIKFSLASQDKLESLDSGHRVAFLGFPMENLSGGNIDAHYPVATMQSGIITSVTDAWMASASPKQSILIHHNLPSAGGASGSPVFDVDGDVVGLHSAGNYTMGLSTAAHSQLTSQIIEQIRELEAEAEAKLKSKSLSPAQKQKIIEETEALARRIAGAPLSVLQMNRVTSASLINFAQRADLLKELLDSPTLR